MKKQLRVTSLKRKQFNVGDKVRVYDGSSITSDKQKDIYIVFDYPELTGEKEVLKELTATVVETDLEGLYATGVFDGLYQQDIKIQIGYGFFYTSSAHVFSESEL